MKRKGFTLIELLVILAMILVVFLVFSEAIFKVMNPRTVTVTVTDKWIKNYSEDGVYLVGTTEGVYEVTDSLLKWRWNSSDVYASIEVGETYNMEIAGFRVPLLSMYPNIYEVYVAE